MMPRCIRMGTLPCSKTCRAIILWRLAMALSPQEGTWRQNFDVCNFIANYENYKMLIEIKCITCKTLNAIMLPKLSPANRLWNSLFSQTPYLGLKILHLWTAVLFHDEASASSNLCNIASSDLFYSLPNACNGLPLMWFLPSAKFLFFFKTPNIHWLRSWDVAGNQSLMWH